MTRAKCYERINKISVESLHATSSVYNSLVVQGSFMAAATVPLLNYQVKALYSVE